MAQGISTLILLLLVSFSSFCQKNKKFKNAPPGTVRINDTLFVDKTEIANVHWREYLHYLVIYDSANLDKALPDTAVWGADTVFRYDSVNNIEIKTYSPDPLAEYYFRHPGFNNCPVVGVSYEQALAFCQWRSDRVNELYARLPESERPFKKVTYRLLTRQEWETFASGGVDSNNRVFRKYHDKTNHFYQTKEAIIDQKSKYDDQALFPFLFTRPVNSYFINKIGTYNFFGNVAEMISEKGIAKGGSFDHLLEECKISNDQYYSKPERWLGFRCVAVIVKAP